MNKAAVTSYFKKLDKSGLFMVETLPDGNALVSDGTVIVRVPSTIPLFDGGAYLPEVGESRSYGPRANSTGTGPKIAKVLAEFEEKIVREAKPTNWLIHHDGELLRVLTTDAGSQRTLCFAEKLLKFLESDNRYWEFYSSRLFRVAETTLLHQGKLEEGHVLLVYEDDGKDGLPILALAATRIEHRLPDYLRQLGAEEKIVA